jgi:hypothetical protein
MTMAFLALPGAGIARDAALCADLYRKLNSLPQIIGNSGEMRRYAQEVSGLNGDIRQLRIDMRKRGCGGGSIVTFGQSEDGVCAEMQHALKAMEAEREAVTQQRNNTRSMMQPSEERVAVLSAIRKSQCTPTDLDVQTAIDEKERIRIRGLALPREDEPQPVAAPKADGPSITRLGPGAPKLAATPEPIQLPPERPYEPDRKVRMVGPRFFPENKLDLANPKLSGPQPLQE